MGRKFLCDRQLEFERENTEACRSWATFYKDATNRLFDVLLASENLLKSKRPEKSRMKLWKEVTKFNKWWGRQ